MPKPSPEKKPKHKKTKKPRSLIDRIPLVAFTSKGFRVKRLQLIKRARRLRNAQFIRLEEEFNGGVLGVIGRRQVKDAEDAFKAAAKASAKQDTDLFDPQRSVRKRYQLFVDAQIAYYETLLEFAKRKKAFKGTLDLIQQEINGLMTEKMA